MPNARRQPAATPNPASDFNWKIDDATNGVEITRFLAPNATEVVVPPEIDGRPVTSVGVNAFKNCRRLTSIALPDGLKTIRYQAFAYCEALTSLVLPNGLKRVGDSFVNCVSLTSVALPNDVEYVSPTAFLTCESLEKFTLAPGPSRYRVVDGVLFSAGGKTLYSFPRNKKTTE